MPNSYVLLEKIVVGAAGASSVTFANIPQTGYTDLKVVLSARTSGSSPYAGIYVSFNNTTGASTAYSMTLLEGFGGVASSKSTSVDTLFPVPHVVGNTATANTFGNAEIYIPNYTSANFKSISIDAVTENNSSTTYDYDLGLSAGLYASTSAITTIKIQPNNPFVANSTFYLYGVAKLGTTPTIAPKATGGDIVMTDGTYWYHQFNSSGTFTPALAFNADMLIVAGAGGGGGAKNGSIGGGGGAGGYQYLTSQSLAATGYTITVGAGGSAGLGSTPTSGTAGSNSVFGALTASVGGGFGGAGEGVGTGASGGNGGSGGGAGFSASTTTTGGTGTAGQGNNGGNEGTGGGGAGGGGAGGAGTAPSAGAGLANSITGTSITYATGGAGTGAAGNGVVPSNPTPNRGIGGDSGWNANGAAGGSGVVIVRYLVA
jgi:hypothetical protein